MMIEESFDYLVCLGTESAAVASTVNRNQGSLYFRLLNSRLAIVNLIGPFRFAAQWVTYGYAGKVARIDKWGDTPSNDFFPADPPTPAENKYDYWQGAACMLLGK